MNTLAAAILIAALNLPCQAEPTPATLSPVQEIIHDFETNRNFQPALRNAKKHRVDEVVAAALARLAVTGDDAPKGEARNRLWRSLTELHNDEYGFEIKNPARVAALTQGLREGPWEVRVTIINHFERIATEPRAAPVL